MKRILFLALLAVVWTAQAQHRVSVRETAEKVAAKADGNLDIRDYKGSVYLQSLAEYALASGDAGFRRQIDSLLDRFAAGGLRGYGSFISYEPGGTAMALMARSSGNPAYRSAASEAAARMWERQPRNADGIMVPPWGDMQARNSLFADIALAVTPYLLYTGRCENNPAYIDYAAQLALKIYDDLEDPSTGLIHQARACNNLAPGQISEDCWSRGNGWFSLAMVSLLRDLPASHPDYPRVRSVAKRFFTSVLAFQDEAGLWHQEMTWPDSYPEISGTGLLLYGIGAAIEAKVLPAKHRRDFLRGLQGMMRYIDAEGNVGNTCSGCLAYRNATKADYASHAYYGNEPHAFGPVVLACSQALRLGIETFETPEPIGSEIAGKVPQCHVRFIRERSGDIAWENDLVAFRIYSRDVRTKVGSGIDFWAKSVDYPVIEKWYALNDQGLEYHVDRGEGYDFYAVGKHRGVGGTGIWHQGTLCVGEPYANYRIYADTPDLLDFEVSYQPYRAGDELICERKRISMRRGTPFFEVCSTVETASGNDAVLAVGLTDFGHAQVTEDAARGTLSLVETLPGHGTIAAAVVAEDWFVSGFAASGSDRLLLLNVKSGVPVRYRVGAAWDGDPRYEQLGEQWRSAVAKEAAAMRKLAENRLRVVAEGGVTHRFFDTSPISPSGRYIALFRLPYEDRTPQPGDTGRVEVTELATGRCIYSAESRGWEMQLGANVQWGATDEELFYNDVDTATWEPYAVRVNIFSGKQLRCAGTVFMVSPDGRSLSSHNLLKSRYAQSGYGVIVPEERISRNIGPVADDGVYVTDLTTNQCRMIASIADIYEKTTPSIAIPDPENYAYYCFQTKWNPQGTRLLTTVQWTPLTGGQRRRAVITMNPDGSDIRTAVTPEQWARNGHHINWMPDGEHLSMNLNVDEDDGVEIVSMRYDGAELTNLYPDGSGHPSFHPQGLPWVLTDAYAGEVQLPNGQTPIRLIDLGRNKESTVAAVNLPPIRNFELRIDAHPVWDKTGRFVVFNAQQAGKRCVMLLDLGDLTGVQP